MKDAACLEEDPQIFFPEKGDSVSGNKAILTCFGCKVRVQCKEYKNMTSSTDGIWAGEYSQRGPKSA